MIHSITKQMMTETGHRLTNYNGKCAHLHGHSYRWEVTAESRDGALDDRGMVGDFSELKGVMKLIIGEFDHAFLFSQHDPFVQHDEFWLLVKSTEGESGRVFIFDWNPTAENMAAHVLNKMQNLVAKMPFRIVKVRVWETATSCAEVVSNVR